MIELVDIDSIRPSTYNPRQADPERLELVRLSLQKLGFLLPIYADQDGEILSGHQRHYVAQQMGCKTVPVARTRLMGLEERKAVNIAFNRGTNDMQVSDTPATLTAAIEKYDVRALADEFPDIALDSPEFFGCTNVREVHIRVLLRQNSGQWKQYASNVSRSLFRQGILMPIIVRGDMVVLNGIGRLQMLAERGDQEVPVIIVPTEKAQLASIMLNLLSMDFDIHTKYEDTLRYNSFRRVRRARKSLGRGFLFAIGWDKPMNDFDMQNPAHAAQWTGKFGRKIVDFGAGHLTETEILRGAGLHVAAFEPYHIRDGENIDKEFSRKLVQDFLDDVRQGTRYSSVFISSVLNSVPFEADRRAIVIICAALCAPSTRLYACASSRNHVNWNHLSGREYLNKDQKSRSVFKLDYEPGISLGELTGKPKVQKYHTKDEFQRLFGAFFKEVKVTEAVSNVQAECSGAYPVNMEALREAIKFEFDLPYPDGSRMGMVEEAMDAFSERLGVKI